MNKFRILVIDDLDDVRDVIVSTLNDIMSVASDTVFKFYGCATAEKAVDWAKREPFDLVITDLCFGNNRTGGNEIIESLKKLDPYCRPKSFIVVSGFIGPEQQQELPGKVALFSKPINFDHLAKTIAGMLSGYKTPSGLYKYSVMIADDEPEIREMLKNLLLVELPGVKIIEAVDGRDAIFKIENQKIDLLITDLSMPKLDGQALIAKVAELPLDKKPRAVVIISAMISADCVKIIPGEAAVFSKPFDDASLVRYLRHCLPSNSN